MPYFLGLKKQNDCHNIMPETFEPKSYPYSVMKMFPKFIPALEENDFF